MVNQRSKITMAAVIVVLVFGVIFAVSRSERSRDLVLQIEPVDPSNEVTVYIGGAVEEPGLFALPRGSRVSSALDLAGLLDTADTSGLQLARVIQDEQSILVPERAERVSSDSVDPESLISAGNSELLDINSATEAQLQQLPGIGPALAASIRERRDLDGPFHTLDDLSEISGISERMVDDLRELATTGD